MLDHRRLGKQCVEAMQIYNAIRNENNGWKNHPIVHMWSGYKSVLLQHKNECIAEWIKREYQNKMAISIINHPVVMPPWMGDEEFHASHRSNLLRKDPVYYGRYNWSQPDNLPYK